MQRLQEMAMGSEARTWAVGRLAGVLLASWWLVLDANAISLTELYAARGVGVFAQNYTDSVSDGVVTYALGPFDEIVSIFYESPSGGSLSASGSLQSEIRPTMVVAAGTLVSTNDLHPYPADNGGSFAELGVSYFFELDEPARFTLSGSLFSTNLSPPPGDERLIMFNSLAEYDPPAGDVLLFMTQADGSFSHTGIAEAGYYALDVSLNLFGNGDLGTTESGNFDLTLAFTTLPEPATGLLIGSGIFAMWSSRTPARIRPCDRRRTQQVVVEG
jgi:hypothetical protein